MKCARCSSYISKPAATVTAGPGSLSYGPRCAEIAGLLPPRVKSKRAASLRRVRVDERQMDLPELEVRP